MDKVYIFDVDGTLTPSRQKMTPKFWDFFSTWAAKNLFYLVTGSDLSKLQEQMNELDGLAEGIFTCCGNQFWRPDIDIENLTAELIYDNKFKVPRKLKSLLGVFLINSQYPHRHGNHIEDRGSMVNFSVIGRDCTQEQREDYFKYDNKKGERRIMSIAIKEKFPDLDAVIGGQISIDIYPKGKDKSQIMEHIKYDHAIPFLDQPQYIFIGDRTMKGGNDYPLAKLMEETDNCSYYQTEGPEQTIEILEELNG